LYLAEPLVDLMSRYAARFSIRALDVTLDSSVAWVGAGLAIAAAVLLAFVPRLPSSHASAGLGLGASTLRITPGTNRRLRLFATLQIAFSFVLLAGAAMLVGTLVTLQSGRTGYDVRRVLAFDIPNPAPGVGQDDVQVRSLYAEGLRRIGSLPGVEAVAAGSFVPWRDAGDDSGQRINITFTAEGYTPADGEEAPRARLRFVSPAFFSVLGVPLAAGREFTDADRSDGEPVAIVNQSLAQRFFPGGEALNRQLAPGISGTPVFRRIVGVVADVDDENVEGRPAPRSSALPPSRKCATRSSRRSGSTRSCSPGSPASPCSSPWSASRVCWRSR
jgi:hypothetical protein